MAAPAKRPSNSGEWCSAINCTNNRSKNPRMSFFRFPKDPESILQALKVKVKSMTPDEKLCTLVFDEMSIKEAVCYDPKQDVVRGFEDYAHLGRSRYIANHACVFMARGLAANWKQPFGFVFSSGTVKDVLLK
ncbi:THAP domain-containing protein 9 [Plakobranchus ocellatus]|uniref:THAP domain-containing protein 9 n=1 Tax=Plakobranchus ocellatus TaxID=259542 RepID=A0AAV4C060_9GAST|nr:THAP domain-containing protein 9 [Plakobranchus ocellatus]